VQLPTSFIESIQHCKGFDQPAFEAVHASGETVTSIRVNSTKLNSNIPFDIDAANKVPWSSDGFYLNERPSFTADPLFHAGAYYVQDASSMFLEEAVKQSVDLSQPLRVLDLCAAPGGKSTLLLSIISKESLLVSNEVIKSRAAILVENISKWGAANTIVTNNDPKDFQRLENYFDVIVIDAPCSGSGLFRKDAAAIEEWSEQNVILCSHRQQRILADVMPALKTDGILIYSTCSYSAAEDEAIADWLVEEFEMGNIRLTITNDWGIVETASEKKQALGYRFYPDKVKGEGFFIAAFRKKENSSDGFHSTKNKLEKLSKKEGEVVSSYLQSSNDYFFFKQNNTTIAFPKIFEEDLLLIQQHLYIKKAGVKLGSIIREELIPEHELAVSNIISKALPAVEVDKETALQYLRRQDIKLDTAHKGWMLITYQQQHLGWIKVLQGRINNYYPKEWRILNK